MSAFSANGVVVSMGGGTCYARSASANSTMSVEGVRVLGKALAQGTAPSGPMETTANIEYYIAGADPGWGIVQSIIGNPTTYGGTSIQIGGASINKAYLTSYSLTAEPDGLITASASFVSYENTQNLVIGTAQAGGNAGNIGFAHGQGSSAGANGVGFSAEASFEWEPLLIMGAQGKPQPQYLFNGGSVSLTVRRAGGGGSVSYCLTNGTATATAAAVCGGGGGQTYSVAGQITAAEVSAEVGGFAEGGITVTRTL
jgi:hypothetical protein